MQSETRVAIYYGPIGWFREQLGTRDYESLLDIVFERDEARQVLKVQLPGEADSDSTKRLPGPANVVAETSDYASLNEHVLTNFVGLILSIDPDEVILHNPPTRVHAQLVRSFATKVEYYEYPAVSRATLFGIHEEFSRRLVGQADVEQRLLAALYPLTRPQRRTPAVLMLYGPSGVGKTETAHLVNDLLDGALLRRQLSMYQNEKFASYLFGGHHSEPSLAQDLLDRESGVILLDEFDKAHPVFHSAFYQLFDDGVFEDKNYTVTLGKALVVCTSNYESEKQIREALGEALFSRFDALIRFRALEPPEVAVVIDRLVRDRLNRMEASERALLDEEHLKNVLRPLCQDAGNVRKLGKTVDEVIGLLLVQSLFAGGDRETGGAEIDSVEARRGQS